MSRGHFAIGVYHPQKQENIGTLFRSAYAFGANYIFTIGTKYKYQSSDTCNASKHIPYFHYNDLDEFKRCSAKDSRLVVVELTNKSHSLNHFVHPERAIYLLGSESGGLPQELLNNNLCVQIPSKICLNVATAGSIVLYSRISKDSN